MRISDWSSDVCSSDLLDIVMIGEEFVEAPKSPKHRRHTARDYINALNTITGQPIRWTLGVATRQIGSRHAGQILRIGQLPGDEAAILLDSLHCVGGETPLLAQIGRAACREREC